MSMVRIVRLPISVAVTRRVLSVWSVALFLSLPPTSYSPPTIIIMGEDLLDSFFLFNVSFTCS